MCNCAVSKSVVSTAHASVSLVFIVLVQVVKVRLCFFIVKAVFIH